MVIKPNVLQGTYFWMFGAFATTVLIVCALALLPYLAPFAPGKADFGEFPKSPLSSNNSGSFLVIVSSFAVQAAAYSKHRRRMRMTMPTRVKASMFALGVAFNASICLAAYLWVRFML